MKREVSLVKNTFILGLGMFLPKVASFVILPVLTGELTKDDYGTYDLITVLVSLLLPAVTLQIQTAAFRFLIEERGNKTEENRIITNILVFTAPVSIVALVVSFFCLFGIGMLERTLICLYFFLDIYASTIRQIARGLSQNKDYSISAVLGAAGRLVFTLLFVLIMHIGLEGATLGLVISVFIEVFYITVKLRLPGRIDFSLISSKSIKQMLKYSWPMVPNNMSMWVMRMSDRIIVTIFMGVGANAVYSVANKIPSLITLAQSTFSKAWQENASIVSKDDDAPAYYTYMFRAVFDFMAGSFALVIAATPLLFKILVRGSYEEAYIQMPRLLLGMFFFSITGYLGGIYVAYKKTKSVGITTMVAAACNLLVDIVLINYIGLYAASLSTLVSYILLCVYRMVDLKKIVQIRYGVPHMLIVTFFLMITGGLCCIHNIWIDIANAGFCVILFVILNKTVIKGFVNMAKSKLNNILKKSK